MLTEEDAIINERECLQQTNIEHSRSENSIVSSKKRKCEESPKKQTKKKPKNRRIEKVLLVLTSKTLILCEPSTT